MIACCSLALRAHSLHRPPRRPDFPFYPAHKLVAPVIPSLAPAWKTPATQKPRPYRAFWQHQHAKSETQISRENRDLNPQNP